jgi:hypothetical protein
VRNRSVGGLTGEAAQTRFLAKSRRRAICLVLARAVRARALTRNLSCGVARMTHGRKNHPLPDSSHTSQLRKDQTSRAQIYTSARAQGGCWSCIPLVSHRGAGCMMHRGAQIARMEEALPSSGGLRQFIHFSKMNRQHCARRCLNGFKQKTGNFRVDNTYHRSMAPRGAAVGGRSQKEVLRTRALWRNLLRSGGKGP